MNTTEDNVYFVWFIIAYQYMGEYFKTDYISKSLSFK